MTQTSNETVYSLDEIHSRLADKLTDWRYHDGHLHRTYKTGKWPLTMMLFGKQEKNMA